MTLASCLLICNNWFSLTKKKKRGWYCVLRMRTLMQGILQGMCTNQSLLIVGYFTTKADWYSQIAAQFNKVTLLQSTVGVVCEDYCDPQAIGANLSSIGSNRFLLWLNVVKIPSRRVWRSWRKRSRVSSVMSTTLIPRCSHAVTTTASSVSTALP